MASPLHATYSPRAEGVVWLAKRRMRGAARTAVECQADTRPTRVMHLGVSYASTDPAQSEGHLLPQVEKVTLDFFRSSPHLF